MNLPFFAVKAYVPGGVKNQAEKKFEKCLPAGTGAKIYFSSVRLQDPHFEVGRSIVGDLTPFGLLA